MVLEGTQLEISVHFHFLLIRTTFNATTPKICYRKLLTYLQQCIVQTPNNYNLKRPRQIQFQA